MTKNGKLILVLGGATALYLVIRKQQTQLTAAQIIAQAKQDLAPLGKPIVTT